MRLRFTFVYMLRDYLEITRLFNMGLTGIAPVLGALSMWTTGNYHFFICLSYLSSDVLRILLDLY